MTLKCKSSWLKKAFGLGKWKVAPTLLRDDFFSQVLVVKGSHLKMIQCDCIACSVVILWFDTNIVMWSEPRWKQK